LRLLTVRFRGSQITKGLTQKIVGRFSKIPLSCQSVRPSAWNSWVPTGLISMKFDI